MRPLTLEHAKAIYRAAVDGQASDAASTEWWAAVHTELGQVLAARSAAQAALVIAWWHHDWTTVGDTAKAAAQRIRAAARTAAP